MGVTDGTPVNAATTNPAFIDATEDDTGTGKYTLANTESVSGPTIDNLQREHNSIASWVGKAINTAKDILPTWTNNDVGTASDDVTTRVDTITAEFNDTTGHTHDGTAGQGFPIPLLTILTNGANAAFTAILNFVVESLSSDPAAGNAGRIFFNSTDSKLKFDDGTTIQEINTGGGGGGGAAPQIPIQIVSDGDSPPTTTVVSDLTPLVFPAGVDRDVRFSLPMDRYTVGDQAKLTIRGYCSSTGNAVLETIASLYETGTDWSAAPTNQRTNAQTIVMPATANDGFRAEVNELMDATGNINAVAVATDDMVTVNLKRKGTDGSDTATGDLFITHIGVNLNG